MTCGTSFALIVCFLITCIGARYRSAGTKSTDWNGAKGAELTALPWIVRMGSWNEGTAMQDRSRRSFSAIVAEFLFLALSGCQSPPGGGAAAAGGEVSETKVLAASGSTQVELGAEPVTVAVPLPGDTRERLLELAEPGRLRLAVEGLRLLRPGLAYEVYLNLPEGAEPDPKGPHFLGLVALYSPPDQSGETTRSFDLAPAARALREGGQGTVELRVTFVPADGKEAAPGGPFLRFRRLALHAR